MLHILLKFLTNLSYCDYNNLFCVESTTNLKSTSVYVMNLKYRQWSHAIVSCNSFYDLIRQISGILSQLFSTQMEIQDFLGTEKW